MEYFVVLKNPSKRTAVSCHERSERWRSHPQGTELALKLNQEDIARMVGATRETVSHSLGKLRDEGAIVRARTPIIVNLDALRKYLE